MANEVKEIALEQVSGGMEEYEVTEKRYNLDKGDTFSAGNGRDFYVVNLTAHGKSKDDSVECSGYIFTDRIGKYQFGEPGISRLKSSSITISSWATELSTHLTLFE